MHNPILIAYWGEDKDVLFIQVFDTGFIYQSDTLFGRMQDRIINGNITEILEYWPNREGRDSTSEASDACDRWRETLRELGYEIRGE